MKPYVFPKNDDVVITNGQYHDHFRPAFPLNLASATAKANFDRTITLPIDMDAWEDYLLAYSDIDINNHQDPMKHIDCNS